MLDGPARANLRILTAGIDRIWATVQTLRFPVARPLADRDYGLRDFAVRDPDGFELRFAMPLGVAAPRDNQQHTEAR